MELLCNTSTYARQHLMACNCQSFKTHPVYPHLAPFEHLTCRTSVQVPSRLLEQSEPSYSNYHCIRQHKEAERQASRFLSRQPETTVPRQLLLELLSESFSTESLLRQKAIQGNCLSVLSGPDGLTILAHPSGQAMELPVLTIVQNLSTPTQFEVKTVKPGSGVHCPINQICFAFKVVAGEDAETSFPYLAVRSQHWIAIFRIEKHGATPPEGLDRHGRNQDDSKPNTGAHSSQGGQHRADSKEDSARDTFSKMPEPWQASQWSLEEVASVQMQASIVNLAWSPHIAKELVFVCDDGYIGLADVTASAPGWPNDMRQTKIHQLGSSSVASCSSCCWCSHPRLIYAVEGTRLLRLDLRTSIQSPVCSVVHQRPDQEDIVCMSHCPEDLRFLAVATRTLVLLLDMANPSTALLKWTCCVSLARTEHLLFNMKHIPQNAGDGFGSDQWEHLYPKQASRDTEAASSVDFLASQLSQATGRRQRSRLNNGLRPHDKVGSITACNFSKGSIHTCRFGQAQGTVQFTALIPELTSMVEDEFGARERTPFGDISVELNAVSGIQSSTREKGSGITPGTAEGCHALGLPQTIAYPLAQESDLRERINIRCCKGLPRNSAADDSADVIGVQIVKTKLSNNVFSETLVRLDPLGHLYLDPAALFTEAAGFGPHCYRNPRELLTSLSQHEQLQDQHAEFHIAARPKSKRQSDPTAWHKIFKHIRGQSGAHAGCSHKDDQGNVQQGDIEEVISLVQNTSVPVTPAEMPSALVIDAQPSDRDLDSFRETNHILRGSIPDYSKKLRLMEARIAVSKIGKGDTKLRQAHLAQAAHWLEVAQRSSSAILCGSLSLQPTRLDTLLGGAANVRQTNHLNLPLLPGPADSRLHQPQQQHAWTDSQVGQAEPLTQVGSQATHTQVTSHVNRFTPCLRESGGHFAVCHTQRNPVDAASHSALRHPYMPAVTLKVGHHAQGRLRPLQESWTTRHSVLWKIGGSETILSSQSLANAALSKPGEGLNATQTAKKSLKQRRKHLTQDGF